MKKKQKTKTEPSSIITDPDEMRKTFVSHTTLDYRELMKCAHYPDMVAKLRGHFFDDIIKAKLAKKFIVIVGNSAKYDDKDLVIKTIPLAKVDIYDLMDDKKKELKFYETMLSKFVEYLKKEKPKVCALGRLGFSGEKDLQTTIGCAIL